MGHQENVTINLTRSYQKCKISLEQPLKDADRVAIYGNTLLTSQSVGP